MDHTDLRLNGDFWWGVLLGAILALLVSQAVQLVNSRRQASSNPEKLHAEKTSKSSDRNGWRDNMNIDANDGQQELLLQASSPKEDELLSDTDESSSFSEGVNMDDADDGATSGSSVDANSTESDSDTPINAPHFPFLRVNNLLKDSTPQRVYPNSRDLQSFRTPTVQGKALIALKLKGNEDPHFEPLFAGKNRRFELQFQLTFTEEPRGIIYVGGEVPQKMQLGLITKGLCKAILGILNRLSSTIHAGFGKKMHSNTERELPHIAFPLWSAATRMIITRAGDTLPKLGEEIVESSEHHRARIKQSTNKPGDLKKGDTVTFSISSMYLDIVRWKTANLGALNDIDLSMFWDTMPLHLVLYDLLGYESKQHKEHSNRTKWYFFAFGIENTVYLRESEQPLVTYPEAISSTRDTISPESTSTCMNQAKSGIDKSDNAIMNEKNSAGEDGLDSLAEESVQDDLPIERVNNQRGAEPACKLPASIPASHLRVVAWIQHAGLRKRSLSTSFVVAYRNSTNGAFSAAFLQSRESFFANLQVRATLDLVGTEGLSKAPKKIWEWEQMRAQLDQGFANAALEAETLEAAAAAVPLPSGWLDARYQLPFARTKEDLNVTIPSKYLEWGRVVFECAVVRCVWETKWNEEWAVVLEQTRCANPDCVILFFQPGSKTPVLSIRVANVLAANELNTVSKTTQEADSFFSAFSNCFSALELEQKERVVVIGFGSDSTRKQLANTVRRKMGEYPSGENILVTSGLTSLTLSNEANRWGAQRRQVINSRRASFMPWRRHSAGTSALIRTLSSNSSVGSNGSNWTPASVNSSPTAPSPLSPRSPISTLSSSSKKAIKCFKRPAHGCGTTKVALAESDILSLRAELETGSKPWQVAADILRAALQIREDSSEKRQIEFFDLSCSLRELDIVAWSSVMTQEEKLCFAVNLYHALRLHAKLLVGQPSSILGWASFGSRISYAIGYGAGAIVLSLAEIEHCILRKPMTLARTVVSTTYPSTQFTQLLALSIPEPRLNFCLNYGTKSCASEIAIFDDPDKIDKLLDDASSRFLREMLRIDLTRGTVSIPKLCYWYGRDFLIKNSQLSSNNGKDLSKQTLGREIMHYVGHAQREEIEQLHTGGKKGWEPVFKVRSFSWKARDYQTELILDQ